MDRRIYVPAVVAAVALVAAGIDVALASVLPDPYPLVVAVTVATGLARYVEAAPRYVRVASWGRLVGDAALTAASTVVAAVVLVAAVRWVTTATVVAVAVAAAVGSGVGVGLFLLRSPVEAGRAHGA